MPIIECENLYKSYGKKDAPFILKGVSLSVGEGEFLVVTGESGAGKTTLLHCLSGAEMPTVGRVLFFGRELSALKRAEADEFCRQKSAFVYQSDRLSENLTIAENILMPRAFRGEPTQKADALFLLESLGMERFADRFPNELSGGERRRIALLRALSVSPKVIFADEPTGNLDRTNSMRVMESLKEYNQKQKSAVVLVTHSEECAAFASRRVMIKDGMIF
ncbi:MAG: ABC transporter ATP-binding protein [Clostridiales bacterium]|jgi:ABC-type lipoprotein export system ATPase subunit|nr:ABC transporter ATP-binding protein [Clostridiales bacterium]